MKNQNISTNQELGTRNYILNLIDTPGHVDFAYEVSRSLAACEGAILVVDATQGVQAQTLANLHQAEAHHLTIIPVINKIDLPNANVEVARKELVELGFRNDEIIEISAKTGKNVDDVLLAIVDRIPAPSGLPDGPLRALIFSSQYDTHKGVVVFVRVVDGRIPFSPQLRLKFCISGAENVPIELGYFMPGWVKKDTLETGEVGYIATGLKDVRMANVGDTITTIEEKQGTGNNKQKTVQPLPGYKEPKSMVFVGLYPIDSSEFVSGRVAMEKLKLSDAAFTFRPISSMALGNGFHCGFLGLLHAEVVQERLTREFDLSLLATSPSVEYRVTLRQGVNPSKAGIRNTNQSDDAKEKLPEDTYLIQSAAEFPDPSYVEYVEEPIMKVEIFCPKRFVGAVMQLSTEKRGEYVDLVYQADQATFTYLLPLSDMIVDFFDRLKSVTEGYASLDYEFFAFQRAEVVKVDILLNHEKVDALSFLAVRDHARSRGKLLVERLVDVLPRQNFLIPVQAAIGSPRSGGAGGEVIARGDIKPFRKDVIAKLYGGDRSRKDKLLKKQKRGKSKMKMIGSVEIPQAAFFDILKTK